MTASGEPIKAVVVDDQEDIRDLLRMNLTQDKRFELVGEAVDGEDAISLVDRVHPDVVVLDLTMPNLDGLSTIRSLRADAPATKVVVFSANYEKYGADELLAQRAHLYVDKSKPVGELLEQIADLFQQES